MYAAACHLHMKLTWKSSVTQMYIALVNKLQPRFAETLNLAKKSSNNIHNIRYRQEWPELIHYVTNIPSVLVGLPIIMC